LLTIKGFPGRDTVTVGELADRLQLIALATLFLQPQQYRPSVILVDEPELSPRNSVGQIFRAGRIPVIQ
jgi:predicted ATPase